MAKTVTEYILRSTADTEGHKKFLEADELLARSLKARGEEFKAGTRSIRAYAHSVKGTGGNLIEVGQVFRDANGNLRTFTDTFQRTGKTFDVVKDKMKETTVLTGGLNDETRTLGETMVALGRRALVVSLVYTAIRGSMQAVSRATRETFTFFVELEKQLAQVAIVGGNTEAAIEELGRGVLRLGTEFGVSFKDMGEAMTLWAQQGKNATEILELMAPTMALSLISGRSLSDSVEDLTAVTISYNLSASQAIDVVDKLSAVMIEHAIDANNLAAGMRRLAPVTAAFNISLEDSIGLITAVQTQTRRGGASVGDSLRTILTRMAKGTADAVQAFADVPFYLDKAGDATYDLTSVQRDHLDVLGDLAAKWETLTVTQRSQIGVTIAGRQRVTEFFALMSNWEEQIKATANAFTSAGRAMQATATLTDTFDSKVKQLQNSWAVLLEQFKGPVLGTAKAGLELLSLAVEQINIQTLIATGNWAGLKDAMSFKREFEAAQALQNEISQIDNLIGAYQKLEQENQRINASIANEARKGDKADTGFIKSLERQKKLLTEEYKEIFDLVEEEFDISIAVEEGLDSVLKKISAKLPEIFSDRTKGKLKQELTSIKKEIEDTADEIDKLEKKGKVVGTFLNRKEGASLLDQASKRRADLEKLKLEEAEIEGILSNQEGLRERASEDLQGFNATLANTVDLELLRQNILKEVADLELSLAKQGVAEDEIKIRQAKLLRDLIQEGGFVDSKGNIKDEQLENALRVKEVEESRIVQSQKLLKLESQHTQEIDKLTALGYNDLQIQARRIAQAKEKLQYGVSQVEVLKQELAYQELISARVASASNDLRGTVSGAFKEGFNTGDFSGFFETISLGIKDRVSEALANLATDKLFQFTGIGDTFGKFITGIETAGESIAASHVTGAELAAPILSQAIVAGATKAATVVGSGSGFTNLNSSPNPLSFGTRAGNGVTPKGSSSLFNFASIGSGRMSDRQIQGIAQGVRKGTDQSILGKINTTGNLSSSRATGFGSGLFGRAGGVSGVAGSAFSILSALQARERGDIGGAAASGALAGSTFGPIGTVVGGVLGAVTTALTTRKDPKALDKGFLGLGFGTSFGDQTRNALGQNGWRGIDKGITDPFGLGMRSFEDQTKNLFFRNGAKGVAKQWFDPLGFAGIFGKGGIFRTKRTLDVEQETKEFQVSSKIEVTNRKLDVVNRNLVAINRSIQTYILPESTYFGAKRGLEDEFSVHARRGLT